MNHNWIPQGHVVESPISVDTSRLDFIQIVPPTPRPAHPQRSLSGYDQPYQVAPFQTTQHLRPTQSQTFLRTHRSQSSITSVGSHGSMHSGQTGWSTVTSNSNGTSDSLPSETDEMATNAGRTISFSTNGGGVIDVNGNELGSDIQPKMDTLSIDPRLFRSRESVSEVDWNEDEEDDHGDGDDVGLQIPAEDATEDLPTAVPRIKKAAAPRKSKSSGDKSGEKKKISHARKQHPEHIPRPRNAFILFRKHVVDSKLIPASVEMRHQNVSIITAKMWSEASPEQKAHFNDQARIEKEEHAKKYPGYRYQPVYRRTNVIRRRVRKDEAEEEKCQSVAELLLKGKSGEALESEIKEKITLSTPSERASKTSTKRDKSASRRSNAACELSKGALRALRAQARQQGSVDWYESSRANSVDYDTPSRSRGTSCRQSLKTDTDEESQTSLPFYGESQSIQIHQQPAPGFYPSGETGWVYPMTWQSPRQESSSYTIHPAQRVFMDPGPSDHALEYQYPTEQFSYSQPEIAPIQTQQQEYFRYDTALPFSPHLETTFTIPPSQNVANEATPTSGRYHTRSDVLFGTFTQHTGGLENPSPVTATYIGMGTGNASNPFTQGMPMSARWDRAHHFNLPPSSEVPMDALPFDDGDGLLRDFDRALAQAGGAPEMDGSVW